MKYVIVDKDGIEVPFIFSCLWNHDDIARDISGRGCVVSAGFLRLDDLGNLYVTGKSVSLGVGSRVEDIELIKRQLEFSL